MLTDKEIKEIAEKTNTTILNNEDDNQYLVLINKKIITINKIKKENKKWLIEKIENKTNNNNKNLRLFFKKNIAVTGNYYFTSFGFSFDNITFNQKELENDIEKINNILIKNNIKYRCELSDCCWAYRFIISQTKENLNKINKLIN